MSIERSNTMASQLSEYLYKTPIGEEDGRRVPQEERKVYDIKNLWARHHEILNLHSMGYKGSEIAEMLGISPVTVSIALNSTLGKERTAELRAIRNGEVEQRLEQVRILTDKALALYHGVLDDAAHGTATLDQQLAVADKVVLELSGMRVPAKVDSRHVTAVLTSEQLSEFNRRGIEAAKSAGLVITDIEAEEVPNKDQ
jgi:DNA-binding CsgD family transcriptional regulator